MRKPEVPWFVTIVLYIFSWIGQAQASEIDGRLDIYWIDVEGGAATLIVTPAGESILIDNGIPGNRDPVRILDTLKNKAKISRIDHLIITHFHLDHYGGTADLAKEVPISQVYDTGLNTEDENLDKTLKDYLGATQGKRKTVHPGDIIPLEIRDNGNSPPLQIKCLGVNQQFVVPEPDQETVNSVCTQHRAKDKDLSENANSTVFLLSFGQFKFFNGGDITWNVENKLVCPFNRVGTVDVFQIDHHGLDSSNNPVLIHSLQPRVVIINNGPHKGCGPHTFKTVQEASSVKAIYQLHKNLDTGPEGNTFSHRIANLEEKCSAELIQVSVDPSGNSYRVTIPANGLVESYETKSKI